MVSNVVVNHTHNLIYFLVLQIITITDEPNNAEPHNAESDTTESETKEAHNYDESDEKMDIDESSS